ncbi:MAG: TetR/AcrR family transcriptional regulator [Nocardioides sp.]
MEPGEARPTTTRDKLLGAAADVLRTEGLSGLSARSVAARAGVNQALVFYHFGSVSELVETALRRSADLAVATYRNRFDDVASFTELLVLGRELHAAERDRGNVAQMAQVMSGALADDTLARAGRYALEQWTRQIETVLGRLLADSPLRGLVEPAGLARAVGASFLGLELYDGVDPDGASSAMSALESLGNLLEMVDGLGPVGTRAVRSQVRKAGRITTPAKRARS